MKKWKKICFFIVLFLIIIGVLIFIHYDVIKSNLFVQHNVIKEDFIYYLELFEDYNCTDDPRDDSCWKSEDDTDYMYYRYEVDFDEYIYTYDYTSTAVVDSNNNLKYSYLRSHYNWKTGFLTAEIKRIDQTEEEKKFAIIDDKGEFVCSVQDADLCYALKLQLFKTKRDFLDLASRSGLELEDLKHLND